MTTAAELAAASAAVKQALAELADKGDRRVRDPATVIARAALMAAEQVRTAKPMLRGSDD